MYDSSCQHALLHYKFIGTERDGESGPDYFGAKYNSSSMGRAASPKLTMQLTLRY
jgi:hypothetical protein